LPPNPGYKLTRDGGLIIHPSLATANDTTMQNPSVDAVQGAGFGDAMSDLDRQFVSEREPVAHFLTYGVAGDITEKWFTVNDPDTEEADPELDRTVQDALAQLKFKARFTQAIEPERIYGWSLLVGAFTDASTLQALQNPLKLGSELKQLSVYPKTAVRIVTSETNPMSPRYGEPVIYELNRGNGVLTQIHYTRCCLVKSRGMVTSNALNDAVHTDSVLDVCWDDMTCGRNIRWGTAQYIYRTGSGFAVFGFPEGTTVQQLEAWSTSGAFSNIMGRTYLCLAQNGTQTNNGMTFDFKGVSGVALDPTPFFKTNIEQISIATGIPQAKLIGAQAGAVTGSEVNMQDYYKFISRCQSALEDVARWVIDRLAESGQIKLVASATATDKLREKLAKVFGKDYRHKTAQTYVLEWNSAFELSEKDEATIEVQHVQACQGKLDYMTKDEVRADEGLDPLPNGEGASITPKGLQLFNQQNQNPNNPNKPQDPNSQQQQMNQADKFLLIDLNPKKANHASKHGDSSSSSNPA
jgi:hypothetical protein